MRLTLRLLLLGFTVSLAPSGLARGEVTTPQGVALRQSSDGAMSYYLSLPRDYQPSEARRWPVLFAFAGMDRNYEGVAHAFSRARGNLPVIVVVPITSANLLDPIRDRHRIVQHWRHPVPKDWWVEDEAGILSVFEEVRSQWHGEDGFYLYAFSSGGLMSHHLLLTHPEAIKGAVLVCANFFDNDYERRGAETKGDPRIPIRVIVGADDPIRYFPSHSKRERLAFFLFMAGLSFLGACVVYWRARRMKPALIGGLAGILAAGLVTLICVRNIGLDYQTKEAERLLRARGFENYQQWLRPGMGHEPSEALVIEHLKPYGDGRNHAKLAHRTVPDHR